MRIALISNVTVDFLATPLRKSHEVYLPAGYDSWQREALDTTSGLYAFEPEVVVTILHAGALEGVWDDVQTGEDCLQDWLLAIRTITESLPGIPVLVSSLDIADGACRAASERRTGLRLEDAFDAGVAKLHADGAGVYTLPVRDLALKMGRNAFYSPKMWYFGSMPWSNGAIKAIAGLVLRYVDASKGAAKKCLAVDLDNTLWGGVVGEDGVEGIVLSHNKEGARYRDAQLALKRMRERGVMLAILSKNNQEDVDLAFAHPSMVLSHEDFVAEAVNWESKPSNIRLLAEDLNIGLDAFVFLDDNPAEREAMREECPEVAVVAFPKDTAELPEVLADAYDEYFLQLEITAEDVSKTEMYRGEARRKSERKASASVHDYLKNLGMRMDLHALKLDEVARATQLANKTNQFNVTTIRYTREEIEALATSKDSDVFMVHMADKYGDQGLVALLVMRYQQEVVEIESFLMSCRIMGRDAEVEIFARLRDVFESRGVELVRASFVRTAKNEPVADLFERLGFECIERKGKELGEAKRYEASTSSLPHVTGLFDNGGDDS